MLHSAFKGSAYLITAAFFFLFVLFLSGCESDSRHSKANQPTNKVGLTQKSHKTNFTDSARG